MKTGFKFAVACSIVLLAAVWPGPMTSVFAAQGAPAAGGASSGTNYKIGVVDMDEVLKNYNKLNTQASALEAEKDKLQKSLDEKSDTLSKKMEAVLKVPEADQEAQREEIKSELRNLNADFQRMQGELNDKRTKLQFQTRQEVIKAIQQIGSDENYHLILEGDEGGRSTVIFFATSINITPKVIEKLNGAAPAPPKK